MWNFLIYLNLWLRQRHGALSIWSSQRAFPERLPLTHMTVLWDSEEAGGLNVLVWMCGAFSFGKYSVIYDTQMHTQALIQCWVNIDNPLEVPPTHTHSLTFWFRDHWKSVRGDKVTAPPTFSHTTTIISVTWCTHPDTLHKCRDLLG